MKRYLFSIFFGLALLVSPLAVFAQASNPAAGGSNPVTTGQAQYTVDNPLGPQGSSFCGLIKALLSAAIQIGIPVAVLFIVYAGFLFVLARGAPEKLKEARKNLMWTLIGIAIFLGAWLLVSVITNTVKQLGGSQNIISCS